MKVKRTIAALLFICLLFSCIPPVQTNAATTEGDYTYEVVDGQATITGYTGPGGDITIPSTLGNCPVIAIGGWAFYNCTNLISVAVSDSVTNIIEGAFSDCINLITVSIPDSVATIGDWAFSGCTSLTEVVIPDKVTTIENYAFANCTSLISVEIPDSVATIDSYAFSWCDNLTSVEIPDSVTTIGDRAFGSCPSLKLVVIPDSVTTIGAYAFYDCDSLTGIWVDENNPNFSSDDKGVLFNKDKTVLIQAPGGISGAYTIPDSVTTIGYNTFENCSSLTSVIIPDSVITIGFAAFYSCTSLTKVIYCGTEQQWNQISIGYDNSKLTNASRQYHDYQNGACTICGAAGVHEHTWENGACTGCEQRLEEALDLDGDGRVTAFDAQILAEAQAGLRTLTDEQWQALGALKVSDIIDYILGRFPGMKTEE